ncbi:TerB family tellurite resistance protein [Aquisalinus flavus]|uniref:Co-chaperone DjlA N-terminal domain-containing protein n=1 Tax=Aquisalinus flavus TaxID=1526572 RepID=A0A8J2V2Z5_9PROT|nr:TerB family tellurite resistance protein [Aquisalinus flavus]MBD0426586.1 TerB family tellurite resistance protein [Aquisalinus flavus]UNE47867.1 TerB family tellurite resistance protein [Aquisalinus flavus]GGD06761.1 hypothetical protein GCM10011342_14490 [Aquisalinus flavus]
MFDKLFSTLKGDKAETQDTVSAGEQNRVAFTALLVEAARADEIYTDKEKGLIAKLVKQQFGIDDAEALSLRERAEEAQAEANDLYRFSSTVKNGLTAEEKIQLVEGMWQIILSDDARDPYEDMIVRRLCGLIYMSDQEAQEARRRVEQRQS